MKRVAKVAFYQLGVVSWCAMEPTSETAWSVLVIMQLFIFGNVIRNPVPTGEPGEEDRDRPKNALELGNILVSRLPD